MNTHSLLLRTELLGPGTLTPTRNAAAGVGAGAGAGAGGGSAPRSNGRRRASSHSVGSASPSRNIFRFQQEREQVRTNLVKQFSLSPLGPASERLLASPRRPPRKVAEAPCVAGVVRAWWRRGEGAVWRQGPWFASPSAVVLCKR